MIEHSEVSGTGRLRPAHPEIGGIALARLDVEWSILHVPGVIASSPRHVVLAAYPLIPWIGVTAAGFGLGPVFVWSGDRRRRALLGMGVAFTAAFILVRGIDIYGDPSPWRAQRSAVFTTLSFLNTTKYPPSLLFLLMTLGPALVLMWALDRREATGPDGRRRGGEAVDRALRPVLVFGKVPMFYFLAHIVAIHGLAVVVCWLRYGSVHWMFESPDLAHFPITEPAGWPWDLRRCT